MKKLIKPTGICAMLLIFINTALLQDINWDGICCLKATRLFFDEIFGKKEPEPQAGILKFEEFEKIVKRYRIVKFVLG